MKDLLLRHPRLWISCSAGVVLFLCLPAGWSTLSRILTAWNGGALLFLVLVVSWMSRLSAHQICERYVEEDESAPFILLAVTVAALISLVAIVEPLAKIRTVTGDERLWHFVLAALTLMSSWLLVPTMFTTHYADLYYSAAADERPLRFPETSTPVFWDFAYFSFTIAAACQTSDVSTAGSHMRKIVLIQTLISFLFNASILGFAINVTAGLLGG
jgi:uncharacterized membrane protein